MKDITLPDEWKFSKLENLVEFTRGSEPGSDSYTEDDSYTRFLRVSDISGTSKEKVYTVANNLKLVGKGDLLITLDGTPGIVSDQFDGAISSGIRKIGIINDELLQDYLKFYLRSDKVQRIIYKYATGATILHASKSIQYIDVIIPPLEVQKKIVEILEKAEKALAKRKESIKLLDELVKSKFIEMFGNAVQNSHGYPTKTIDELCQNILGGGTPAKSHPEYYGGDIPWVTPKDMKSDTINTAQIYINEQGVSNSSAKMIPSNSLLMVIRSGILKHTLPIAINKCEVTVNQDMKAFVIKDDINIEYFFCAIKNIEKDLLSNVRSVTADNIEFSIIRNYQLPVPSKKMQNEFATFVKQIDKLKFEMQKSLKEMENNFSSLMQRAFKGELFKLVIDYQ